MVTSNSSQYIGQFSLKVCCLEGNMLFTRDRDVCTWLRGNEPVRENTCKSFQKDAYIFS